MPIQNVTAPDDLDEMTGEELVEEVRRLRRRFERHLAECPSLPPGLRGGSQQQVAADRCLGDCLWRHCSDHDELVSMQEDATELPSLLYRILAWPEHAGDEVSPVDFAPFVRAHNWPDPQVAQLLADSLEDLFANCHPGGSDR